MGRITAAIAAALLLAGIGAPAARAGVPKACIHPRADPLECPVATREVLLRVLPSARVRALAHQRRALEREAPLQDRARKRLNCAPSLR